MFDYEEPIEYGLTLGKELNRRRRQELREKAGRIFEGVFVICGILGMIGYGWWSLYRLLTAQAVMFMYRG